jgi:hypothetical protein
VDDCHVIRISDPEAGPAAVQNGAYFQSSFKFYT